MISKPLFKQSIKANWGIWTAITAATCFMLGIIIMVVGGSSINNIMSSVGDTFVKNSVQAEAGRAAMDTYYMASAAMGAISYSQMLLLNAAFFVTMFTFAGICFLTSAWFNLSKHAMALGGGISILAKIPA